MNYDNNDGRMAVPGSTNSTIRSTSHISDPPSTPFTDILGRQIESHMNMGGTFDEEFTDGVQQEVRWKADHLANVGLQLADKYQHVVSSMVSGVVSGYESLARDIYRSSEANLLDANAARTRALLAKSFMSNTCITDAAEPLEKMETIDKPPSPMTTPLAQPRASDAAFSKMFHPGKFNDVIKNTVACGFCYERIDKKEILATTGIPKCPACGLAISSKASATEVPPAMGLPPLPPRVATTPADWGLPPLSPRVAATAAPAPVAATDSADCGLPPLSPRVAATAAPVPVAATDSADCGLPPLSPRVATAPAPVAATDSADRRFPVIRNNPSLAADDDSFSLAVGRYFTTPQGKRHRRF
jgi:hypothetical protein